MKIRRWLLSCLVVLLPLAASAPAAELTGRILGERCVQQGDIGDCYLKWAEPMVLWSSETGDYYYIELAGSEASPQKAAEGCSPEDFCFQGESLTQVALDKSFAQGEAEVEGKIIGDRKIRISRLELINPPGEREFTKG
ncbi:MAG: hypothetical protein GWO03_00830 [Gammaproteobacteria bacterium]|nr:hypothetical protein [Gammaproteobacteria bacterium]